MAPGDIVSVYVAAVLPQVTAELLPDLLRIACSRGEAYSFMVDMLLDHDRDCLHVLHEGNAPAASSSARRSSKGQSSTDAVPQQQSQGMQALVADLLWPMLKWEYNARHLMDRLCITRAAQQLGECCSCFAHALKTPVRTGLSS